MNHKLYPIAEVINVTGATASVANGDATVRTLGYDSRKLTDVEHTLFFALKGRRDGHTFIDEAYRTGVRNFVISDDRFNSRKYKDANFLKVEDTVCPGLCAGKIQDETLGKAQNQTRPEAKTGTGKTDRKSTEVH